jgi:hypothetical protein
MTGNIGPDLLLIVALCCIADIGTVWVFHRPEDQARAQPRRDEGRQSTAHGNRPSTCGAMIRLRLAWLGHQESVGLRFVAGSPERLAHLAERIG